MKASGSSSKAAADKTKPSQHFQKPSYKKGIFHTDLIQMMYGFGDHRKPLPKTVALVEELVIDYIAIMMHKIRDLQNTTGNSSMEKLLISLCKDTRHLQRVDELIKSESEIKEAKKIYNKRPLDDAFIKPMEKKRRVG